MDNEEVEMEVILIEPKLHDRWSLLLAATSLVADVAETVANNLATLSIMAAQHTKQKHYDRKFREITK